MEVDKGYHTLYAIHHYWPAVLLGVNCMVTKNGLMISSRKPSLSKYRLSPISPYSRDHQSYLSQSDDKCQDHETTATVS
ncbi:MAG: hypothetical protein CM1200mP22_04100 [Dehalococcoidia bacterium]|nr:MAG: hypothetical protein CM1200mP22_04100 [Dehalococcoidia bacterium]